MFNIIKSMLHNLIHVKSQHILISSLTMYLLVAKIFIFSLTSYGQENEEGKDDYEETGATWQAESPRDLHSGDVINKMKYRPLPAPPRPPREKRNRGSSRGSSVQPTEDDEQSFDDRDGGGERIASSSVADSTEQPMSDIQETDATTQTDPLPADFVCEEFEITPDMKIIEPRVPVKSLNELMQQEEQNMQTEVDEQLARGLQRFREANQRSISERSRASSQADRSRSLSRPQTPSSAIIIERRVSTPVPIGQEIETENVVAASIVVHPIDDLELEEQALRREGLLTDSSQQSKSDVETDVEEIATRLILSDYSQEEASSVELNAALDNLRTNNKTDESEVESAVESAENRSVTKSEELQEGKESEDDLDVDAILRRIKQEEEEEQRQSEYYENELLRLAEAERELEEKQKLAELQEREEAAERKYEENIRILQEQIEREEEEEEIERARKHDEEEAQDFVNKLKEKIERDMQEKEARKLEEKLQQAAKEQEETENQDIVEEFNEGIPQPPPRRKSLANTETTGDLIPTSNNVEIGTITEEQSEMVPKQYALPTHISDLEVERLRVHALQAGKIMVSQLQGGHISSDELECNSGNLIVKNLELPAGFIDDIVQRVRSSERGQLLSSETQTSEHTSRERLLEIHDESQITDTSSVPNMVPPPKPPRQRDILQTQSTTLTATQQNQLDEETQTQTPMMPVFPTIEYLQTLAPLAFYNLDKQPNPNSFDESHATHAHGHHHHRSRHHYHRCESSSSDDEIANSAAPAAASTEVDSEQTALPPQRRRHHTRSPITKQSSSESQSLSQATRQFISACSLSLVRVINQVTNTFNEKAAMTDEAGTSEVNRLRQTPQQLILLFVVLAIFILVFMLTGRNVHTHHWDYFNPPGNEGRPS